MGRPTPVGRVAARGWAALIAAGAARTGHAGAPGRVRARRIAVGTLKSGTNPADDPSMPVVPKTDAALIDFGAAHVLAWEPVAEQIGLTADEVTEYKVLVDAARAAYDRAEEARLAAMAATTALRSALTALRTRSGGLVKKIKAFDRPGADPSAPSVYALAQIPPDALPVGPRPPGSPENLSIELVPGGGLRLSWTATDASSAKGGLFMVERRTVPALGRGESDYENIGYAPGTTRASRRVTFVDTQIPAGTRSVTYRIIPARGGRVGEPGPAVCVEFGGALREMVTGSNGQRAKCA